MRLFKLPKMNLSLGLLCMVAGLTGCSNSNSVDVVDLNKVLDAFVAVIDESTENADAAAADKPVAENPAKESEFLTKYAAKLNETKAMNSQVGVAMTPGGEIVGFKDPNGNNVQEMGETKEFTVTVDTENNRLVASDNNGHHRPYGFSSGGFFTGYMLASMLGRQNSFYNGANSGAKPNFRNTQMSSPDYHRGAQQSARSAASSARSRSGSRGFSFGK